MKVLFVVDSLDNLNSKVELFKQTFGEDINFIVKANYAKLFYTYGYPVTAVYTKNLANVMQTSLMRMDVGDVVVYYSSLNINSKFLTTFVNAINDRTKVINVIPKYNAWEKINNSLYNSFVKSLFKTQDSLASPKLQFLPAVFVEELLSLHFANKLFEVHPAHVTNIYVEDLDDVPQPLNKSLKIKPKFGKFQLIPIIVVLAITALLIMCLGLFKFHFLFIILFVCLYLADIILGTIFQFKNFFDERFLR